jgi:GGDEF domain-containing protein
VGVEEKSIQVVMDHMVHEAQQSIMRQYALANVSKTLCDKLEDCDIVVQHKDHFLIVLPETRPEDIPGLTRRLRKQIEEQVGVELKIGTASLPNDGYTLDGLIQKATLDMETDGELIRLAPIQPQAVK